MWNSFRGQSASMKLISREMRNVGVLTTEASLERISTSEMVEDANAVVLLIFVIWLVSMGSELLDHQLCVAKVDLSPLLKLVPVDSACE
jgi:hypothetical protein